MTPTVLGLIGILAGPLIGGFIAWRGKSGNIKASDATDLWAESRAMRQFINDENARLRSDLSQVSENLRAVHAEHEQCKADLSVQRLATARLEQRITELEAS